MSTSAASVPVVTIDGPSGSGKGTVSQRVAGEFGWHLLDSGALYRLLACAAQRDGVGLDDAAALAELAGRIDGEFTLAPDGSEVVRLDGADVTETLCMVLDTPHAGHVPATSVSGIGSQSAMAADHSSRGLSTSSSAASVRSARVFSAPAMSPAST